MQNFLTYETCKRLQEAQIGQDIETECFYLYENKKIKIINKKQHWFKNYVHKYDWSNL